MPNFNHMGPENLGPKTGMKVGKQNQILMSILKIDPLEKGDEKNVIMIIK